MQPRSVSMPRISVVIPSYGRADLLRKAVESLFAQDLAPDDYEVIVVDSSRDTAVAAVMAGLQRQAPCDLHFYTKKPEGPGPSRNLGVTHSRGEFIAFLDSDCVATSGWLSAGLNTFQSGTGIVQGQTLPNPHQPLGVFKQYIRVERESFVYETANIFYRRQCFGEVGGFMKDWTPTSQWIMGGEDVDLAWRVKRKGWKTAFCEDALVYHEVLPLSMARWIVIKRMIVFPWMIRRFPELRRFFYARYFYDKAQALLVLGLAGVLLCAFSWWTLLLCMPYVLFRGSESSGTLRGILRVLRPCCYMLRDFSTLVLLVIGSVRSGALLL